jgi:hypothetical protein
MLAHANSTMMVIRRMVELVLDNSGSLAIVLFAGAVMSKSLFRKNGGSLQTEWQRNILAVLGLICFGLAICSANYQKSQIPLFGLGALVLCETFRRNMLSIEKDAKDQPENMTRYLAGALASLYLMGLILVPDASSIAYTLRWRSLCASPYIPKHARVPSDTMKDMVFPPKPGANKEESLIIDEIVKGQPWNSDHYSCAVNNGLGLLRQRVNKGSRILVMEYINPFPFALKLPGPSGNALFWKYGQVISDRDYPAPEKVFKGVTLVLTRTLTTETSDFMQRAYGPYLQKWFEKIDESPILVLFKRRDMQ